MMCIIIDEHLFEGEPVSTTLYCRCGAIWRAHHKIKKHGDSFIYIVSKGCPNCGTRGDIIKSSTDPEEWSING